MTSPFDPDSKDTMKVLFFKKFLFEKYISCMLNRGNAKGKLSKELLSEKKGKKPVSVCQSVLGTRSSLLVTLQCSEE